MYPPSGDQNNFVNATQGADTLVHAFEAAVSNLSFGCEEDEAYVYASDYNALVDRFNQLVRREAWWRHQHGRLAAENERLRRLLCAAQVR